MSSFSSSNHNCAIDVIYITDQQQLTRQFRKFITFLEENYLFSNIKIR